MVWMDEKMSILEGGDKEKDKRIRWKSWILSDQITITANYKTQRINYLINRRAFCPRTASKAEISSSIAVTPDASTSSVYPRRCTLCSYYCACVSLLVLATHLQLAATQLSLPGSGTVYSDTLGLIVLHVNMTRRLTRYRVS